MHNGKREGEGARPEGGARVPGRPHDKAIKEARASGTLGLLVLEAHRAFVANLELLGAALVERRAARGGSCPPIRPPRLCGAKNAPRWPAACARCMPG